MATSDCQGVSPIVRDALQKKVIGIDSGYHLVLASAGCGKTDILAERVKRALASGINAEEMLCLTFTNRAARGMKARIEESCSEPVNDLFIGNIHRFCSRFLFENGIISESSAIMDEEDAFSVLYTLWKQIKPHESGNTDENDEEIILSYAARTTLTVIYQLQHLLTQYRLGHSKNLILNNTSDYKDREHSVRFYSPRQFANLCLEAGMEVSTENLVRLYDHAPSGLDITQFSAGSRELIELLAAARQYESYKRRHNLVDFEDLLLLTYSTLSNRPDMRPAYKWIQVDEVQDLNPLQFAIIDLLSADDNVTMYLGDEQQAIYSFIGAKLSALDTLKRKCGTNVHHLDKCYRSPKYLLDVFNDYAQLELETDPEFLPQPNNDVAPEYGDLKVWHCKNSNSAARIAVTECLRNPAGRTAILVSSNAEADMVSNALGKVAHFKFSGTDLFSSAQVKLLLSHLNVVYDDVNYLSWARILYILKIIRTFSGARDFVMALKENALSPADLLNHGELPYVLRFSKAWSENDVVIFDTETTGLNIYEDDIVQIAATKYRGGKAIDSLNLILHTGREIPRKLGTLDNPLIKEYESRPHLDRKEGLQQFLDFAKGAVIIGHNVEYDFNILRQNCIKELGINELSNIMGPRFDTLKLSRLLFPRLHNYKLGGLIEHFGLLGKNTHLADADIDATYHLAAHCLNEIIKRKEQIIAHFQSTSYFADKLIDKYGQLYALSKTILYKRLNDSSNPLLEELRRSYSFLISKGLPRLDKVEYVLKYVKEFMSHHGRVSSLYEDLSAHIMDLNTLKEADLCDSKVINENIFVATVHKAKGLEFENVIVYGCVDGVYPFFATQFDPEQCREDARKLYVAISRAKKRLCLISYNQRIIQKNGKVFSFDAKLSPFLSSILSRHNFVTENEV